MPDKQDNNDEGLDTEITNVFAALDSDDYSAAMNALDDVGWWATEVEDALRTATALATADGCILCHQAPADLAGVFLPTDSQAWGAEPGKHRVIANGLCDRCFRRRDHLVAIEARLSLRLVEVRT